MWPRHQTEDSRRWPPPLVQLASWTVTSAHRSGESRMLASAQSWRCPQRALRLPVFVRSYPF